MSNALIDQYRDEESSRADPGEHLDVDEQDNSQVLTYHGKEIKTVEDLLEHARVDLAVWEIERQSVNRWEVGGKRRMGQKNGQWQPDSLWKTGLLQIKVTLRRRAPKPIQDAIKDLVANWKPTPVKLAVKRRKLRDPHMCEMGLYDHHFGKLAWKMETGTDYDLKIAEREWNHASDAMLQRAAMFDVEKIVIPIGNDFFHTNNWEGTTARGTRVESVDDRASKVFQVGFRCVERTIRSAMQVAPIEVLWVPGNHDPHTSWYLMFAIQAAFRDCKHAKIDLGPKYRKYMTYGPALLGYTHGDSVKPDKLPGLMATEVPDLWSQSRFRLWRTGHFHKRKEDRYTVGDTFNGVEVRIFPSLAGTDHWHYTQGFTGNCRMAECHMFSRKDGPVAYYLVNGTPQPA